MRNQKIPSVDAAAWASTLENVKTRTNYEKTVVAFEEHLNDIGLTWNEVAPEEIATYLSRARTANYHNTMLSALRSYLDHLVEAGYLSVNPARAVERRKTEKKKRRRRYRKTIEKMREAVLSHAAEDERKRNLTLISLRVEMRLKMGEVSGLREDDVHYVLKNGKKVPAALTVTGSKGKRREVNLSPRAAANLAAWLAELVELKQYVKEYYYDQQHFGDFFPEADFQLERPPQGGLWLATGDKKRGWPLSESGHRYILTAAEERAGRPKTDEAAAKEIVQVRPEELCHIYPCGAVQYSLFYNG